jgi:hypothetical protein
MVCFLVPAAEAPRIFGSLLIRKPFDLRSY